MHGWLFGIVVGWCVFSGGPCWAVLGGAKCLSAVVAPGGLAMASAVQWKFERPVEINFMCTYGLVESLEARDSLRQLLRDVGVEGSVTVTNQGAAQGVEEDESRFTDAETAKKLLGKTYVVLMTTLGQGTYTRMAEWLATPAGRTAVAAQLRAGGAPDLASRLDAEGERLLPILWSVDTLPVDDRSPTSVTMAQVIWNQVVAREAARGNRLVPVLNR